MVTSGSASEPVRGPQGLAHLPGFELADPDVADLACGHEVVHGPYRFVDGRFFIECVKQVNVDMVGAQSTQRPLYFGQDVNPGAAAVVHARADPAVDLRSDHDLFAPGLEDGAKDFLGQRPIPEMIEVGAVDEVHAGVYGVLYDALGFDNRGLASEAETQGDPGDLDPGAP